MEEKKLTDEEVIKALDICYNDVHCSVDCPYFNLNGRNFCQDKELYKDLKRIVQEHAEQKAEIERLTEKNEELEERNRILKKYKSMWSELDTKNTELQKQVDELKANQVIECHGMLKGCDIVKQAVKDTAKEIYTQVLEWFSVGEDYSVFIHNIEQWLKEKYGVEFE